VLVDAGGGVDGKSQNTDRGLPGNLPAAAHPSPPPRGEKWTLR
jgi:hypothetical protein